MGVAVVVDQSEVESSGSGNGDVALLRSAAGGDADAVRRLVDDLGPIVYGFVYARVGGNEAVAADLVQETFLEAVRSAPGFRGDSALSTWLCTIARRRVGRHYERERRQEVARRGLQLLHGDGELADPATGDDDVDRRDEIVRALGGLSPLHRQVLVLKYLDGQTVEEIAAALGRSRVQIQSLLQRARTGLRQALGGDDG